MIELNKRALKEAEEAYLNHNGDVRESLAVAIRKYLKEEFKPGQITTLEVGDALQPQRDYRKELWVSVYLQAKNMPAANAGKALQAFDAEFGGGK